jgi:hypothetical protein
MTTAYTSLLGLALPVTGELSGTWGDTVNDYITKYIDAAVAGAQTISGSQTAVTLSTTNGTSLSQAGSGATGSAQYQIINCTGNPATALTVTVPSASKVYLVLNNTSTSQTVTVKGSATTGVTVAAARSALIAWNGTDFELVASTDASQLGGILAVANGGTGQSSYTDGQLLIGNSTGNTLTKSTLTAGSGVSISNGSGSITISATGLGGTVTSVSFTGGIVSVATATTTPALTVAGTSGGIPYFSSSSTWASSGALAANALVVGGGAGVAPSTITTGTGVVTALGVNVGSSGAFVTNGGALGTPSSGNLTNTTVDGTNKVGYRNLPAVGTKSSSYTLAVADVGKYVQLTTGGSIVIPTSTFAEGDAITLFNNTTGNITITCSAPTAYIAGFNTVKTSMTLTTRGVATILFISSTVCVVTGNVT